MDSHVSNKVPFMPECTPAFRTFVLLVTGLRRNIVGIMVQILMTSEQLLLTEGLHVKNHTFFFSLPELSDSGLRYSMSTLPDHKGHTGKVSGQYEPAYETPDDAEMTRRKGTDRI